MQPEALTRFEIAQQKFYDCAISTQAIGSSEAAWGLMSIGRRGPFDVRRIDVSHIRSHRPVLGERWADQAFLAVQIAGSLHVEQYGREICLPAGHMMLHDSRSVCNLTAAADSSVMVMNFDRNLLRRAQTAPETVFNRLICGDQGLGRLLLAFLRSLFDEEAELDDVDQAVILNSVVSLLSRSIDHTLDGVSLSEDLLRRMRDWATRRLPDPALSPAQLATEFGMSRRSLYRFFADVHTTPSQWIWQLRLDEARRLLADAAYERQTITDVAFSVGFTDAAHFSRAFRRRFGCSPRMLRG